MRGASKIAGRVDAVRNRTMKFDRMGRRVEYIECDGAVTKEFIRHLKSAFRQQYVE